MISNKLVKRFLTFIIEVLFLGFFLGVLSNIIPIPPTLKNIIILSAITLLLAIILFCLKFLWPRLPNKPKKPVILTVGIASILTIILFIVLVWSQQDICLTSAKLEKYISTGERSLTQKETLDEKDREQQIYDNNKDLNENNSYLLALAIPAKTEPQAAKAMLAGVADAQTKFNQPYNDPTKPRISKKLLKIVVVDDQNNEDKFAEKVACQIAQNPNILGVIGHHSSGSSKAALDTYAKAGITMITPTSTSTKLNQNSGKVFFRTTVTNADLGEILARRIANLDSKVSVFYEGSNEYAEDLKEQFIKFLSPIRIAEEHDIKYWNNTHIDRLAIPNNVKAAVIFSSSGKSQKHEIAIKLIKKLKRTRPDLQLFGGDSLYKGSTLYDGKTDIEGLKLVIPWFPVKSDGQIISDYATKSAATWGGPINWMTASSYDATQAFLVAIAQIEQTSRRKVDRKSVLDFMPNVYLEQKDTSGAGLKFDNGEPKDFDNGEPKDRKPIFVEVVQKEKLPKILQCNLKVCFKPVE